LPTTLPATGEPILVLALAGLGVVLVGVVVWGVTAREEERR
jgi:LPXTG-motif cell wall-anchored protein